MTADLEPYAEHVVFIDGFEFPIPFLGGAAWSLDRAEGVQRRGVRCIPSPSPTSPRPYVEPQHGGRGTNPRRPQ